MTAIDYTSIAGATGAQLRASSDLLATARQLMRIDPRLALLALLGELRASTHPMKGVFAKDA